MASYLPHACAHISPRCADHPSADEYGPAIAGSVAAHPDWWSCRPGGGRSPFAPDRRVLGHLAVLAGGSGLLQVVELLGVLQRVVHVDLSGGDLSGEHLSDGVDRGLRLAVTPREAA